MKSSFNYTKVPGLFISLSIFILLLNSCEVANDLINNPSVAKIEGEWRCDETSEYFKKSTTSSYKVYISPDADNDNGIILDRFYNLGDLGVRANVSGLTITIPQQTMEGGYTILSGSGYVSGNYKEITWSYDIKFAGDAVDHVTAVFTKVN